MQPISTNRLNCLLDRSALQGGLAMAPWWLRPEPEPRDEPVLRHGKDNLVGEVANHMKAWEKFQRIEVRQLLKLRGWRVSDETLLGPIRIDLYAEKESEFSEVERIAVECKNYAERLSKETLERIVAAYLPLIENKKIDRILVVTRHGLSPAAETYKRQLRAVAHQTIHELLDSVIDFSGYVHGMRAQLAYDDLDKLYVEQGFKAYGAGEVSTEEEPNLVSYVLDWIESPDTQPLAVLAGYGMGKSSFARKLCHLLAERHVSDHASRIPILLRLDEIAAEQTLDGLLGRHFTSLSVVPRYNFHTFMNLNSLGRFVICLDGFDEMKKTMTWESLRYNLQQLHQLCVGDAKVILLGRPTAFLDEAEQEEGLHGRVRLNGRESRIPGWPDFKEIYLEPFTASELAEYFRRTLKVTSFSPDKRKRLVRALKGLTSGSERRLVDIASRPVQAKMLIEVLPDYNGPLDSLTTCVLYDEFINIVIRRELQKASRHGTFPLVKRRLFCRQLAAWMWTQKIGTQVALSNIPDEVFRGLVSQDSDDDGLRRDLLSGSVLEKKPPEGFYFPHRSFQEFLVAEHLVELAEGQSQLFLQFPYITPEVCEFFLELFAPKRYKPMKAWILSRRGHVGRQAAELFVMLARHLRDSLDPQYAELLVTGEMIEGKKFTAAAVALEKTDTAPKLEKKGQKRHPHRSSGVTRKKGWW